MEEINLCSFVLGAEFIDDSESFDDERIELKKEGNPILYK